MGAMKLLVYGIDFPTTVAISIDSISLLSLVADLQEVSIIAKIKETRMLNLENIALCFLVNK